MIHFTAEAWKDYLYWQDTDKNIVRKINDLLKDCVRDPFRGLGKPEPLKGKLKGFWSRRINDEHRLLAGVDPEYVETKNTRKTK